MTTRLIGGVEYAQAPAIEEPKLRAAFKRRQGGGATPLVLVADDAQGGGLVRVLGPAKDGPLRRVRADSLLALVQRSAALGRLQAVRLVAEEVERLDTERVAGLKVSGLGTEHLYGERLPSSTRWAALEQAAQGVSRAGWRELLNDLGYDIEPLPRQGYLAKFGGRPVIVVHPRSSAFGFARLDEQGRLPEGALVAECQAQGAPWGILAAGTRLRLLTAGEQDAGSTTRYLELDAVGLEPGMAPLLGLLAPDSLAGDGLRGVLAEARDYGQQLRERLDLVLRQDVLPVLGRELGRWAAADGRDLADDRVREQLESAALMWVFRALFLLYAESAGHLPMTNPTYASKSLTRIAQRAWEEHEEADARACSLWDDVSSLVRKMRTGQRAWDLPAYNGDLFAADGVAGAQILETATISDAALGPALVALARDEDDRDVGVDFSGLEIGHLGYVYEGLLSLRLSVADRPYVYDEHADRYRVPAGEERASVAAGELLWLTNEGGRKGGGVYYTRTELVRHLVRGAVGPAFERHLQRVRALAATDPTAAAAALFEFHVLDPACGSAHFLVEVVDELADRIGTLLGDLALPAVREQLDALRGGAGATFGAGIEDTALLKRLVLKRCVYGVDVSALGTEIAKVSLWLSTFVPGLSLAYLDHNVQRGNSLIGVARPDTIGEGTIFAERINEQIAAAAVAAARLRRIDDSTPDRFRESKAADADLHDQIAGARRVFDLWTAEPLGLPGARQEAELHGADILTGAASDLADDAASLAADEHVLHWPLAFAEVFARERPGFDAVVGNPPWEEVTVEELAFYARYRPGLRALPETARRAELGRLLDERPELEDMLEAEQERMLGLRSALGPAGGYEATPGDPDVYKLFCQRYQTVLRDGGALGVVLPRNAFAAKGSISFRNWLFERARPERIDFLVNRRLWAFDIHPQYSVALLVAQRRDPDPAGAFRVAGVASSAEEFASQVRRPGVRLTTAAMSPEREIPLLGTQREADLLAHLRTGDQFPTGSDDRWKCFSVREFDETADHRLWDGASSGWPLWKGESFEQFRPLGSQARWCPTSEAAMRVALKVRPGAGSLLAKTVDVAERRAAVKRELGRARIAYRRVTRGADSRTIIACLIPPEIFLAYTGPYLAFVEGSDVERAACLGVMNSLSFDWQARRYVELSLSMTTLESLHMPKLDGHFASISGAAARLSCPDERFAAFAAETGVEVGPLAVDERAALRADIDARVARAWNLTSAELEVVFADFTMDAVPADYRQAVRDHFAELDPA